MKKDDLHYRIFKKGSKTYFTSSLFFPPDKRDDVFILYGFVRTADDYVDEIPQDSDGFYKFCSDYRSVLAGNGECGNPIIDRFVELSRRKNFDPAWTEAFLHSMELDLRKKVYQTLDDTLEYIYGSAEVIGLYMSRLMELPEEAFHSARMLGRAMQYINFIRDIAEDNELGRRYLPVEGSGLESLSEEYCRTHSDSFIDFHRKQIRLYTQWHNEAVNGYSYIPKKMRVPIKTADDMYMWTASQIEKDPFIVFRRKVKPEKGRIIRQVIKNFFTA